MKTQKEIEQMKDNVQRKTNNVSAKIQEVIDGQLSEPSMVSLMNERAQLMAQYNILIEVLK